MATQNEIRKRISEQIVAALEQGLKPWRKPWSAGENCGFPTNVASKNLYRGVNPLLLELSAHKHGFTSRFWGTYRQWQAIGGQVQKRPEHVISGQWGTKIIFYKPVVVTKQSDHGDEEETTFPMLREYTVFCADQVDGADEFRCRPVTGTSTIDYQPAETVVTATGADIRHQFGDKACYFRPPADYIQMPLKEQFEGNLPGYYGTIFHELSHWSECRLGWEGTYALGELRAELSAAYLTAAVGIPQGESEFVDNNASYLGSWIQTMKADHKVIFQVSSAASRATDFILSFSEEEADESHKKELIAV